jgi:hypothetical protein
VDGWRRSGGDIAARDNAAIDGGFARPASRFAVRGTSGCDLDGWGRAADHPARETVAVDGGFAGHRFDARSKRKLTRSRRDRFAPGGR